MKTIRRTAISLVSVVLVATGVTVVAPAAQAATTREDVRSIQWPAPKAFGVKGSWKAAWAVSGGKERSKKCRAAVKCPSLGWQQKKRAAGLVFTQQAGEGSKKRIRQLRAATLRNNTQGARPLKVNRKRSGKYEIIRMQGTGMVDPMGTHLRAIRRVIVIFAGTRWVETEVYSVVVASKIHEGLRNVQKVTTSWSAQVKKTKALAAPSAGKLAHINRVYY